MTEIKQSIKKPRGRPISVEHSGKTPQELKKIYNYKSYQKHKLNYQIRYYAEKYPNLFSENSEHSVVIKQFLKTNGLNETFIDFIKPLIQSLVISYKIPKATEDCDNWNNKYLDWFKD